MGKIVLALALMFAFAGIVHADPDSTLAESPREGYEDFKAFVNRLDPAAEELLSFKNLEFFEGFSGSLYRIAPNAIELANLRLGYALDKIGYGSVIVNVANLGHRYLPDSFNAFFDTIPTPFKGKVAKYGRLGFWTGWDVDDSEVDGGATFGLRIPLP